MEDKVMSEGKRIIMLATDDDFFAGYPHGYLRYQAEHKGKPVSDDTIHQVVTTALAQSEYSDRYNAGYIAGWFAGLYNKSFHMEPPQPILTLVKGGDHE
jgi:hypothetical protein